MEDSSAPVLAFAPVLKGTDYDARMLSYPKDVIFYQVVMEGRKKYSDAYLVTSSLIC